MIEVEITNELYWLTYDEAQTAYTVGIAGAGSTLTANHDFLILKTTSYSQQKTKTLSFFKDYRIVEYNS